MLSGHTNTIHPGWKRHLHKCDAPYPHRAWTHPLLPAPPPPWGKGRKQQMEDGGRREGDSSCYCNQSDVRSNSPVKVLGDGERQHINPLQSASWTTLLQPIVLELRFLKNKFKVICSAHPDNVSNGPFRLLLTLPQITLV